LGARLIDHPGDLARERVVVAFLRGRFAAAREEVQPGPTVEAYRDLGPADVDAGFHVRAVWRSGWRRRSEGASTSAGRTTRGLANGTSGHPASGRSRCAAAAA